MTSSATALPDPVDDLAAAVGRAAHGDVAALTPVLRGGNSRVFRAELTDGRQLAVKRYPEEPDFQPDRMTIENAALAFLCVCGAERWVPEPVAASADDRFALFHWIDGEPVAPLDPAARRDGDAERLLAFLDMLHRLRHRPEAKALPPAREACSDVGDVVAQIRERRHRLATVSKQHPPLAEFLGAFADVAEQVEVPSQKRGDVAAAAPEHLTLSPSDFGYHNAIRRPDGSFAFVDFDYFGWDDPVKLTADTLWHPAMVLSDGERRILANGMADLYGDDPGYAARLAVYMPLLGLKWCLIMLNEFLPERRDRRAFAHGDADPDVIRDHQLAKAVAQLDAVQQLREAA